MPTTPRLALRYPALTDVPNGPLAIQNLGLDVESWLNRAFPCTSTSRPASPPQGMIIYETDTGEWRGWTGAAWEQINGTSGGSGSGSGGAATVVADAQYSASGTQTIPNNSDTPVAFGSAQATTPYVVRSPRGVGHQFELTIGGLWAVSATIRYAKVSGADGELRAGLFSTAAPTEPLVSNGGGDEGSAPTFTWSVQRRFAPGAVLFVTANQQTGPNRPLDRGVNGATVRINFALVGR